MEKEEILKDGSIYHYTSLQGLKGILEEKVIWLTHYKFLNDPNELNYCKQKSNKNIANALIEIIPNDLIPMIASFSENPDSYSLWANYTNHYGVNIEFDIEKLRQNFQEFQKKQKAKWLKIFVEGRMIYSAELQENIAKEISHKSNKIFNEMISDLLNEFPALKKLNSKEKIKKMASEEMYILKMKQNDKWDDFAGNIGNLFGRNLFFKSSAFDVEDEYRLCFMINKPLLSNQINFNTKNNLLIPYISIPLSINNKKNNPIISITLGPKNKTPIIIESLDYFLKYKKLEDIIIKKSSIDLQ